MEFAYTFPPKSFFKKDYRFLTDILETITEVKPFNYDTEYYRLRDHIQSYSRSGELREVIRNIKVSMDDADDDYCIAHIYHFDAGICMLSLYHHLWSKCTPSDKDRLSPFLKTRVNNFTKGLWMLNQHFFYLKYNLSMRRYLEYQLMKSIDTRLEQIISPYLYTKIEEDEVKSRIQSLPKSTFELIEKEIQSSILQK